MAENRSHTPLVAALLVVGAFLVVLLLLASSDRPAEVEEAPPSASPAAPAPPPSVDLAPAAAPATEEAPADPAPAISPAPPPAGAGIATRERRLLRVRGLVVDAGGAPQADVRVELHGCHERGQGEGEWPAAAPEVGEPFAGRLLAGQWGALRARIGAARTGADGRFEAAVEGGPLERIVLLLAAAEGAEGAMAFAHVEPVLPDEAGLLDLGRLALVPTSRLEVLVRGDGRPLQGATVQVYGTVPLQGGRRSDERVELVAETDATGVAVLRRLRSDLELSVTHPARAGVCRQVRGEVPPPPVLRVEVDLPAATEVRGVVRDARGLPLPGIELVVGTRVDEERPTPETLLIGEGAVSDDAGRFALPLVAIGQELQLQVKDPSGEHVDATLVFVAPTAELDVRLADSTSVLLTLVPGEGVAPAGLRGLVTVAARRANAADRDGFRTVSGFRIERRGDALRRLRSEKPAPRRTRKPPDDDQVRVIDLAPGTYRFHVSSDELCGWSSGEVTVRLGEEAAVSVRLVPMRSLRGRLVDAAGRPIPAVRLELDYAPTALASSFSASFWTDAQGRFSLDRVLPEVTEVVLGREGFESRRLLLGPSFDLGDVVLEQSPR